MNYEILQARLGRAEATLHGLLEGETYASGVGRLFVGARA